MGEIKGNLIGGMHRIDGWPESIESMDMAAINGRQSDSRNRWNWWVWRQSIESTSTADGIPNR